MRLQVTQYATQQRGGTPLGSQQESYRQGAVSTFGTLPRGGSQQPSNYGQYNDAGSLMRQAQLNQMQQYNTALGRKDA